MTEPIPTRNNTRTNPGQGGRSEGRAYQITKLQDNHQEILRRLLLGQSQVEIAEDLGIEKVVVGYVRHGAVGKEQMRLMQGAANQEAVEVKRRIQQASLEAIAVMEGLLDDETVPISLRLRAAQDILDRAGHAAVRTIKTDNLHTMLTAADIEDIKARARASGCVVDAEVIEEDGEEEGGDDLCA